MSQREELTRTQASRTTSGPTLIPLKPVLTALAPIEEVLNRGFDELIHVLVLAGSQFVLDPLFDLGATLTLADPQFPSKKSSTIASNHPGRF